MDIRRTSEVGLPNPKSGKAWHKGMEEGKISPGKENLTASRGGNGENKEPAQVQQCSEKAQQYATAVRESIASEAERCEKIPRADGSGLLDLGAVLEESEATAAEEQRKREAEEKREAEDARRASRVSWEAEQRAARYSQAAEVVARGVKEAAEREESRAAGRKKKMMETRYGRREPLTFDEELSQVVKEGLGIALGGQAAQKPGTDGSKRTGGETQHQPTPHPPLPPLPPEAPNPGGGPSPRRGQARRRAQPHLPPRLHR